MWYFIYSCSLPYVKYYFIFDLICQFINSYTCITHFRTFSFSEGNFQNPRVKNQGLTNAQFGIEIAFEWRIRSPLFSTCDTIICFFMTIFCYIYIRRKYIFKDTLFQNLTLYIYIYIYIYIWPHRGWGGGALNAESPQNTFARILKSSLVTK